MLPKEQRKLKRQIKKIYKGYLIRKTIIVLEIVSLVIFLPFLVYSLVNTVTELGKNAKLVASEQGYQLSKTWNMFVCNISTKGVKNFKFTGFGIWMVIWGLLTDINVIVSIILVVRMKSPKATTKRIKKILDAHPELADYAAKCEAEQKN